MNTTTTPTRTTAIAWTDHTINFWWGCTKVSPACTHCYAEKLGAYFGTRLFGQPVKWGKGQPRFERLLQARQEALKLNHRASRCRVLNGIPMIYGGGCETVGIPSSKRHHIYDARIPSKKRPEAVEIKPTEWEALPAYRPRVFVNSMSDWLDNEVPIAWLAHLLETIRLCPHLDFQLLTKRPENWESRIAAISECYNIQHEADKAAWGYVAEWYLGRIAPTNIWLGTTTENQEYADKRIPHLLKIPAKIRFLSCEPLSGPLNIDYALYRSKASRVCPYCLFATNRLSETHCPNDGKPLGPDPAIDWIIAGGESGASASPADPDWFRNLRDQCAANKVPFFFKQWGEWIPVDQLRHVEGGSLLKSYKGQKLPDGTLMLRTGTKLSSNLLDGHKHEAFPQSQS